MTQRGIVLFTTPRNISVRPDDVASIGIPLSRVISHRKFLHERAKRLWPTASHSSPINHCILANINLVPEHGKVLHLAFRTIGEGVGDRHTFAPAGVPVGPCHLARPSNLLHWRRFQTAHRLAPVTLERDAKGSACDRPKDRVPRRR